MEAWVQNQAKRHAERSAMRLIAFSDATWPDTEIKSLAVEEITSEAVIFATHARRDMNFSDATNIIQLSPITRIHFDENSRVEKDLRFAVNAIIHAKEIMVWSVEASVQQYRDCGNTQMPGLLVTTDKYPARLIDLRGMAWAYLTMPPQYKTA